MVEAGSAVSAGAGSDGEASRAIVADGRLRPVEGQPGREDGFLPSRAQQTHAAFLLPLRSGDLLCAWFAGTEEGRPDVSIHVARLRAGASDWDAEERLADDPGRSEQNPVLFEAPSGEVWLLYTSQELGNQDTSVVRRRTSADGGRTWSAPETLFDEPGIFIRNPVVVLGNGDWLLPVFHCQPVPGEKWHGHNDVSAVKVSSDLGRTWTEVAVPGSVGAVHMNIVDLGPDGLLALYRSRYADRVKQSRSADGGRTWTAPADTDLPNNNSSIQARRLRDGTIALVFNDVSAADSPDRRAGLYDGLDDPTPPKGEPSPESAALRRAVWGTPRAPLTLALSRDGGRTWPVRRVVETSSGRALSNDTSTGEMRNTELSYPSVAELPDGRLGIAFTFFRRGIKFVRATREWAESA